jgi:hypothetical protein
MSYEGSYHYQERKPWKNATGIEQPNIAPLIRSTMKQQPSMRMNDFNISHKKEITFNANEREQTTHESRNTPDGPLQSQRMKYFLPASDRHVHTSTSNEFVTVNQWAQSKTKDSNCDQALIQRINSGRDYLDLQQKVQHAHKPEITLQPIYGRQNGTSRSKPRRTFIMYKHELPEIIESETSSTADSSVCDDSPKECTTEYHKNQRSSDKYMGEHVKSGRVLVKGRTETAIPQHHPKYSSSSHEMREGTAVSYMKQTTPDGYNDEKKSCPMIEVAPGKLMQLRGADETWHAIHNDFYSPCMCVCCEQTLFCIKNAAYVLCPACRVISPMEHRPGESEGGVGLGFTMENLAQWQNDMFRDYEATRTHHK